MNIWQVNKLQAEKQFQSLPFPSSNDENYRFLSMDENSYEQTASSANDSMQAQSAFSLDKGEAALLTLSGTKANLQTTDALENKKIIFTDLEQASHKFSKELAPYLVLQEKFSQDKFTQLAAARCVNGAFIFAQKNQILEQPLRVALWKSSETMVARNIIVLEEGANLSIIEEHAGVDESQNPSAIVLTEVHVKAGAKLTYFYVQRYGSDTNFFHRLLVSLEKDAQIEIFPISVGGKKGQLRLDLSSKSTGASSHVSGATKGKADQQFDFWIQADHLVPKTKSALDYWFVMDGKSKAIFNGMIHITKDATQTEAYQKSRSLLLSSKATVHAIPKLEIATDEVKCSHGASVSTLNPEQVHYLQARGISKNEAEKMIIRGFTEPVLTKLPTEALYERVDQYFTEASKEVLQ